MSKYHKAFCAHDSKLGVFLPPFFMQHAGQALRAWEDLCNDGKSMMARHPTDFQLYEIGYFSEDTGALVAGDPKQIATATEFVKPEKLV